MIKYVRRKSVALLGSRTSTPLFLVMLSPFVTKKKTLLDIPTNTLQTETGGKKLIEVGLILKYEL